MEPKTMNAYTRLKPFTFSTTHPIPDFSNLKPDQVFVKVLAAAINPVDYKAPKSIMGMVVGLDVCGIVQAVGTDSPFPIGSKVFGTAHGTLANYVICKHTSLALAPTSITTAETACLPTVYLTGLQALRKYGNLQPGGSVLIIGASGGCGLAGIQYAKELGATVITGVCSGKNKALVLENGATSVIDYTTTNFWDDKTKYDVVYDTATNSGKGEAYKTHALSVLTKGNTESKSHGQYVTINAATGMWLKLLCCCCWLPKNQHLFLTDANTNDLKDIAARVDKTDGVVKPIVFKQYAFNAENVEEGFNQLKSRRTVGKIVFVMEEEANPIIIEEAA